MKFFQKRGVAIVVLILAIVASSAWGLHKAPAVSTPEGGEKLDPSLSTAAFEQYVRDEANVLFGQDRKGGQPLQRQLGQDVRQHHGRRDGAVVG